jgi:hypothetical protein
MTTWGASRDTHGKLRDDSSGGLRRPLGQSLGTRRHDRSEGSPAHAVDTHGTTLRGGDGDPRATHRRPPPRPLREVSQNLSKNSATARHGDVTDHRNTLPRTLPEGLRKTPAGPLRGLRHHAPQRPDRPPRHLRHVLHGALTDPPRHARSAPSLKAPRTTSTSPRHDPLLRPRRPLDTLGHHPRQRPRRPPQHPPQRPRRDPSTSPGTTSCASLEDPSIPFATTLPRSRRHARGRQSASSATTVSRKSRGP